MTHPFSHLRAALALTAAVSLAACAPGLRDQHGAYRLRDTANPSAVIATELAFARAAREDGQWTAFREFAADDALIFARGGAIEAAPWLEAQDDPERSVEWEPYAVWSSCDGSLAVTQGGFREPDGTQGVFSTVWRRQRNDEYRWVFDFGYPTDSPPREPESIAAKVADCNVAAAATGADPAMAVRYSRDRTLAWSFLIASDGTRSYKVWLAGDGNPAPVVDVTLAPAQS